MKSKWAWIAVLLAVVLYAPSVGYDFVFDDHILIEKNLSIRDFSNIAAISTSNFSPDAEPKSQMGGQFRHLPFWRPAPLFLWSLVYRIAGLAPAAYHLLNVFLHGLCTLLVFLLCRNLSRQGKAAFFAAALFALHPANTETVLWVSGGCDLLVALFVLAALNCYHQFRSGGSLLWGIPVLVFCVCACLSKENGIIVVAVLPAYELLICSHSGRVRAWSLLGCTFAAAAGYLAIRWNIVGPLESRLFDLSSVPLLSTLTVVLGHYARLFLFPVHLVSTYPTRIYENLQDPDVLMGAGFLVLMIIFLAAVVRNRKDIFALILMGFSLLPALNVIGLGINLLAERYLYLSMAGFCFLLSNAVMVKFKRIPTRVCAVLLTVLLGCFVIRDIVRLPEWRDEYSYLSAAVRNAPEAYIYQNHLGVYLSEEAHDLEGAQRAFETAVHFKPDYAEAHSNLALIYLEKGYFDLALRHSRQAAIFDPIMLSPLISAGEAACRLGLVKECKDFLNRALVLDPGNIKIHNNLGNAAFQEGDIAGAVKAWKKVEELSPNAQVFYNLALGYETLLQTDKALHYYRLFLETAPPMMGELRQAARSKIEAYKDK